VGIQGDIAKSLEFGVDMLSVWQIGRGEFTAWLLPTGLLAYAFYVRSRTRFSIPRAGLAVVAMMAVLWFLTVAIPLPAYAWMLVNQATSDGLAHGWTAPISWILVLLISALISTASQFAVLCFLKHRVTKPGFGLLVLVNLFCLVLASYRMWVYVATHPAEA
jgi:hypothetical protein